MRRQMTYKKIFNHPEREMIIEKLLEGVSPTELELELKSLHPSSAKLQISRYLLEDFKRTQLNVSKDLQKEVAKKLNSGAKALTEEERNEFKNSLKEAVQGNSAYQEAVKTIVTKELDVTSKLLEMDKVISTRIEHYFNLLQSGQDVGIAEDKVFMEYIREQKSTMEMWKKYIEKFADQRVEHNINVNIVNEQISVIKNVVLEVLKELQPYLVPIFVEKLNARLISLSPGTDDYRETSTGQKLLGIIDAEE